MSLWILQSALKPQCWMGRDAGKMQSHARPLSLRRVCRSDQAFEERKDYRQHPLKFAGRATTGPGMENGAHSTENILTKRGEGA